MPATTSWVFSPPTGGATTILEMPFVPLAVVVVAAFRMPPRWSTILAGGDRRFGVLLCEPGAGTFLRAIRSLRTPWVPCSLYLATLVVINFLLTVVLLEKKSNLSAHAPARSDYRNFIEHSSEAVWRVELSSPMEPHLPVDDQIAWLQTHAYVAESNLTCAHEPRNGPVRDRSAPVAR